VIFLYKKTGHRGDDRVKRCGKLGLKGIKITPTFFVFGGHAAKNSQPEHTD